MTSVFAIPAFMSTARLHGKAFARYSCARSEAGVTSPVSVFKDFPSQKGVSLTVRNNIYHQNSAKLPSLQWWSLALTYSLTSIVSTHSGCHEQYYVQVHLSIAEFSAVPQMMLAHILEKYYSTSLQFCPFMLGDIY